MGRNSLYLPCIYISKDDVGQTVLLKCWLGIGAGAENLHFPTPNWSKGAAMKNPMKHQLSCTCGDFSASWDPLYWNPTALHHPSSVEKSCSRCFFPSFVWSFQRSVSLNSHWYGGIASTPSPPILACITINLLTTLNKLKWISWGCLSVGKVSPLPQLWALNKAVAWQGQHRHPSEIIRCQLPSGICQSKAKRKKRQPLSDLWIKRALPLHVVATGKISFVFEALKISLPLRLAESAQRFETPFPYEGNKTKLMVTEIPST